MDLVHLDTLGRPETELHAEDLRPIPGQLGLFIFGGDQTHHDGQIEDVPVRRCSGCRRTLPVTEFSRSRAVPDGLNRSCRSCVRRNTRVYRGVAREHADMEPAPSERCAICVGDGGKRGLFLDHDHATGLFRGWLCHGCNSAIGQLIDDPELLRRAIAYLEAAART